MPPLALVERLVNYKRVLFSLTFYVGNHRFDLRVLERGVELAKSGIRPIGKPASSSAGAA